MLLLAWKTSPEVVGIYAWGILAYTFIGAISDSTMRQIVVVSLKSHSGVNFVRKYRRVVMVAGPLALAVVIGVIWVTSSDEQKSTAWTLLPLTLGPAALAWNILNIGVLQSAHQWRFLATGQVAASLTALAVGIPMVLVLGNPLGAAIGAVLVEIMMAIWCRNALASHGLCPASRSGGASKQYSTMAVYSGLAWGQGQTDRLFVGFVAGSYTLGVLSLGASLSRALGDAVASSSANLLRAEIAGAETGINRHSGNKVLQRGMLLAGAAALLTALGSKWVLTPLMSESWLPALAIVPILCLSVVPSVLSWTAPIYHLSYGTKKRAVLGPFLSILVALPLSLLSLWSLWALAMGILVREFLLVAIHYSVLGRNAPWRAFFEALGITAGLALLLLVIHII